MRQPIQITERRVLRVPRGTVSQYIDVAREQGCAEIEERDGLIDGRPYVYVEHIIPLMPPDYANEYRAADTLEERLHVIARRLGLL